MSFLVPGWRRRLEQYRAREEESTALRVAALPCRPPEALTTIHRIETAEEAVGLVRFLRSSAISAIALDSETRFDRPPVPLHSGGTWRDIRSVRTVCVSLAAWFDRDAIFRAILDVRRKGAVLDALEAILRLRTPLVVHGAKRFLFSLWSLGLDPDLPMLHDTRVVASCLLLGRFHERGRRGERTETEAEAIRRAERLAREEEYELSLVGQSVRYGLGFPFSESQDGLSEPSFSGIGEEDRIGEHLLSRAAANAEGTLRLYLAQHEDILRNGLHDRLQRIEFPFAVANARIEWNGVFMDPARRKRVREGLERAVEHYARICIEYGIDPPGSRDVFLRFLRKQGLEHHARRDGRVSIDDRVLETIGGLHPAIPAYRFHRYYRRVLGEEWISGILDGADGRVHPDHRQLGAATGRNGCRLPNLAALSRVLRPVVVAPAGRALVELDYSQVEIGVAAAEYGDQDLIDAYNRGDVYAAMAQRFHAPTLTPEERALDPREFKRRRPDLRESMKTLVLAITYNIQAPTIAVRYGISVEEAEEHRQRLLGLYPALARRLEESVAEGLSRGYAVTVTGLRRRTDGMENASPTWVRNFLRNTPIQGSAADVLKKAVIELDRAFRGTAVRGTEVRIILPIHDAVLIECPEGELDEVTARGRAILEEALRSLYPALTPRVEVNRSDPSCWNKDGRSDSLERFLEDPTFRLDRDEVRGEGSPPDGDSSTDPGLPSIDELIAACDDHRLDVEELRELYEERAGILEFEAGLSREEAEDEAFQALPRMAMAIPRDWRLTEAGT